MSYDSKWSGNPVTLHVVVVPYPQQIAPEVSCSGVVSFGVWKVQLHCVWFAEEAADLTLMWLVRLKIQILNEPFCCCSVWCRDPAAESLRKGDKILVEKRFINCGRTSLLILSVFLAVLKGDEVNAWIWSVTFIPSDKILFLYLVMCYLHIKRKLQVFSPWWSVLQIKCRKQWVAPIP